MIFFDAHVHLYPAYDRDCLFDAFTAHARRFAPQAEHFAMALMLRAGQGSLAELLQATCRPGQRWRCLREIGPGAALMGDGAAEVLVFAARQIAARERIELLGLFSEAKIPDGLPLDETWHRLRDAGALPVLAWGLGKWLFGRAPLIRRLIEEAPRRDALMIGDSALRPTCWGLPRPMALARRKGLRIVHGSDPLPRPGEARVAGGYASLVDGVLGSDNPAADLRRLLLDPAVTVQPVGRRQGLVATLRRLR